jgi:hypothetical protein
VADNYLDELLLSPKQEQADIGSYLINYAQEKEIIAHLILIEQRITSE